MIEIKFCGMMRPEDALNAARLDAAYVGVIFADSPRRLTDDRAREVFAVLPPAVKRVGVFGREDADAIAARAERVGLQVVQLHGDPDAQSIAAVRSRWSGEVWAVHRVSGSAIGAGVADLLATADALVLDARVDGKLGGTGVTLPWGELRARLPVRAGAARLVLAGGLTPENVAQAVEAFEPDIVDVSSGVESAPGVKDHGRMRAFRDAVHWAVTR